MQPALVVFAALSVGLGILTYILFQKTFLNIHLDIFITSPPKEVYLFIKEPKNWPDIHVKTKSIQLQRLLVDPDGTEHREFLTTEEFRHVGLQTVSMRSSASLDSMAIHISSVSLYSLVRSHIVINMKPYQLRNRQGTLVTESLDIYIPYGLKNFVNKTTHETHLTMLENLKFILERTYNVDKDLNNEFEHFNQIEEADDTEQEEELHEDEEEDLPNEEEDEDDSWDLFHKG